MMKIAVPAREGTLDSAVDPRFGRCAYFIIVDVETGEFEAVSNPAVSAMGGAGVQAAQLVANKGVEAVIANNIGPNAFGTLSAGNIKVLCGASGTVKDVVEQVKKGELREVAGPTTPGPFA
jgi:predicted Fe-Mo cluster-binding NifX family protein